MIKKLLPTVIGAVLIGGMSAAQADVTVFGHLDTSVAGIDTDEGFITLGKTGNTWSGSAAGEDNDDVNFYCSTCSIGFKGSEDLGNGLKAIFKLDFQFDMFNRNSNGSITDRDQWLGLAGNFGQVVFGTTSTSYKSHGAMIDPLYRTVAQGRDHNMQSFLHSNAGEDGQGRADNTVRYDSPDFNGLKFTAHYTLDSDENDGCISDPDATPPLVNCGEDDDAFGAGVQYTNGGILVFADYVTNDSSQINATNTNGNIYGDVEGWKVGGKYTLNNFAVYGQYEDIDVNTGGNEEMTLWHIAGSYTMGNNVVYLGYGNTEVEADTTTSEPEVDSFTLGGYHSLSKRTIVYAAYNMKEQDLDVNDGSDDPEQTVWGVGMKHKF